MKTEQERKAHKFYLNHKYQEENRKPCVYLITNRFTGEQYAGATVNLKQRMVRHWCDLRGGRGHSEQFLAAFRRDGKSAFEVSVLEYLAEHLLYEREAHYMRVLKPTYNGAHRGKEADRIANLQAALAAKDAELATLRTENEELKRLVHQIRVMGEEGMGQNGGQDI
jgi:group I intron endonuclease